MLENQTKTAVFSIAINTLVAREKRLLFLGMATNDNA